MTTSLFSQKNVCAALGFVMAMTIVFKANQEAKQNRQTARFEYAKPTTTIGTALVFTSDEQSEFQKNKSTEEDIFCLQWT